MFQKSSQCFWYRKATPGQTFGGKGCSFWNLALNTFEKDTFFQKTKKVRLVRIARERIHKKIIKKCLFFSVSKAGTFPNNFFWDKMSSFETTCKTLQGKCPFFKKDEIHPAQSSTLHSSSAMLQPRATGTPVAPTTDSKG